MSVFYAVCSLAGSHLRSGKRIRLAHQPAPTPQKNYPKNFSYIAPKVNFSNKIIFHARLKEAITWPTKLTHTKKFLHLHEKTKFSCSKKRFLILNPKNISYACPKKIKFSKLK